MNCQTARLYNLFEQVLLPVMQFRNHLIGRDHFTAKPRQVPYPVYMYQVDKDTRVRNYNFHFGILILSLNSARRIPARAAAFDSEIISSAKAR